MQKIDEYLISLPAWQSDNLTLFRTLVHEVDPTIVEDWKWNVPFFMINGKMHFAMSAFKYHTKYNFIHNGVTIDDPKHLFNNGLESKSSRSIDLREGETINQTDLKTLIEVSLNHG